HLTPSPSLFPYTTLFRSGLMTPAELKSLIRTVPDFPKRGIMFRDITTLLANGKGLTASVEIIAGRANAVGAGAIAGLEARGFILDRKSTRLNSSHVKISY